ncbi:cell division cycle-associated protein 2 isoform X3 [Acanthochromis polyacanthus]|uniref:cell division cycle-associated protein 2 isoform X3 n=1 Tax=Acanthochromis polyacanthus TaxID=80966 RepID=UPI00223430C8|nr:cell division cycle-associated protein 2 isoform X3 [Acanthochromis polyacanthus]
MATVEMNTAGPNGEQKEKMLSSSEEAAPSILNESLPPLNFSGLTPSEFGISVQSFTPASSSDRKDKSRLAQIKARRRSNIGVRGSPETNSLIRFVAQQRMKTPPTTQTPELVRSSPFLPRVASTLRQKMASFQSLMDVEESDACDPMPTQDSNTGGCIKTRDYLSDGNSRGGKENNPPMMPTPSKRRRLGPLDSCSVEIKEASTPIPHSSLKEQEDGVFELQSPSRPLADNPAAASPPQHYSHFIIPSLPSLSEMKPTGEKDSTGTPTVKKKKKQVRFGGPLSPEFFDKNLPPSTPLQKGGMPARAPTPGEGLQLRSVLKTPQRNESQPDLSSPTVFGASPEFAMPRNCRMPSEGEETEEKDGKIVFPSMEEADSAGTSDAECTWVTQPLNLNTAFYEESLSQIVTESDTKPSTTSQMDVLDEPASHPEEGKQPEAEAEAPTPAQSTNRRKKPQPAQEATTEALTRSSSRKRKQPEESEPVKRSTRSAAKSASGKMKMTSTAARRWNRDVDRSLYGSRAYASKNPTLSPITERLSFISQSPAAQQTLSKRVTDPNQETCLNLEMAADSQVIADLAVTKILETASRDSFTSSNSDEENATGKGRRLSGSRVRRGGLKKRKVSGADGGLTSEKLQDQTGAKTEQHCEEQTTTSPQVSRGSTSKHTVPEQGDVDTEELCGQIFADIPCIDSDEKSECYPPTSDCSPSTEESNNTQPTQRETINSSVPQEQQNHLEEHQTSHEGEEKGQGEQATSQQGNIQSSSVSPEEGAVHDIELAPWQAEFNFDDVFKPVATRGQRSVRRSLRNQSKGEHAGSAGLAWLPRTSPDFNREARRRTRGRRLSAALPAHPSLPEEAQTTP